MLTNNIIKKILLVLSISVVSFFNTIPAYAVDDFFSDWTSDTNNQFYNPNDCDPTAASNIDSPTTTQPSNSDNLSGDTGGEQAYHFFVGKGLSKQGAAGIVGNLMRETGGDTYNLNPKASGTYHGVFQWDSGRWAKLVKWANNQKQSPNSLSVQLNYSWKEMQDDYASVIPKLKNGSDPGQAARDFNDIFEGGAGGDQRAKNAEKAYGDFKDKSSPNTISDTASDSSSSAAKGVEFDDSQSSDTGRQTTVDDDGIDPSPTGSGYHQSHTSYADGKLGWKKTQYIALNPGWASANKLKLGDVAKLTYKNKTIYAVYGDNHVGDTPHAEISVSAILALTGETDPKKADNIRGVHFTVYPNTNKELAGSVDQTKIDKIGAQASGGTTSTDNSQQDSSNVCCATDSLSDTAPGSGSPTGVSFPNLDPASMAAAINKYIDKTNPDSKMKGLGETIVKTAQKSNINPFVIVGIAQMESGLSSPSDYNVSNGNNSFGRTATESQPHFNGSRLWYKWSSVEASVDSDAPENQGTDSGDIAAYIRNSGFYDKGLSSNNLKEIVYVYAPPSENKSDEYVRNVTNWVKSMANTADGTSTDGYTSGFSSGDTCCATNNTETVSGEGSSAVPSDWKQLYKTSLKTKINKLARGKITSPKILAIHYTEYDGEGPTLINDWLNNPNEGCGTGCGIQFNIGKDGTIYQYYPLDNMQKTYHVGNANNKAIGIEITGRDVNALLGNDAQFKSVVALSQYLCDYYHIPCSEPKGDITKTDISGAQGMLGHDEIPTDDHNDPDAEYRKDITRTDSAKHPYMVKLRTAMGFEPTPGSSSDTLDTSDGSGSSGGGANCADTSSSGEDGEIPSGTSKELAQKLLDLKADGKYTCDNAGDCSDLEKVAKGDTIAGSSGCTAQTLDPKLLSTILFLINSGYKIGTYALCGDHFKDSRSGVTGHSVGRGVDISSVDGKPLNNSSSKSAALNVARVLSNNADKLGVCQIITDGVGNVHDGDFTKFLYYNIGGTKAKGSAAVSIYSGDLAAHRNHIHAGVCGKAL